MAVNTSWREDIRHTVFPYAKRGRRFAAGCIKGLCSLRSKGRWGKNLYSRKQEGSGALRRPGSSRRRACGPWASPVPPAGRAGSERELYMPPVGGSRGAAIKLIARRAIPPPFEPSEPSEPFEPSEPSRPKGVSNGNPQPSGPEGPSNLRTFLQPFPADWYLSTYASLSSCTEILHFVQNDASGGKYASDSFSIPHSPIPSP